MLRLKDFKEKTLKMNLPNIEYKSHILPNNNLNYFACSAQKFILLFYARVQTELQTELQTDRVNCRGASLLKSNNSHEDISWKQD